VLLDGTEAATMVKQAGEAATEERKNHISGQPGVENDKAETSETNVTTLSVGSTCQAPTTTRSCKVRLDQDGSGKSRCGWCQVSWSC
jgi:hypothetical protein